MGITGLITFVTIGTFSGWLTSSLMKGRSFGLYGNMIIGTLGAIAGGFVLEMFGVPEGGLLTLFGTAVAGAAVMIYFVGLIKN